MGADLISPLQEIIKRAAANKIDGPVARIKKRLADSTSEIVILADCSGSMSDFIGSVGIRKCDHLKIALADVLKYYPTIKIIAFNSTARVIDGLTDLPAPSGGTALAKALVVASKFKPRKTIIISDGLPDSQPLALEAAEAITGVIDVIYCGPEGSPAIDFMQRLARDCGGTQFSWDGYRGEISSAIRRLLA